MPGRVVAHVASAQLIAGIEKAGSRGCAHRFYRSHAAARPHAPFLSGAAVSIDQMQPKCNQNDQNLGSQPKVWGPIKQSPCQSPGANSGSAPPLGERHNHTCQ